MKYDCESLLRSIITNILTINSLAGLKSTRTCAVCRIKFTLSRLHISLFAGTIVIRLQKTVLSNSLPMWFPANKPQQWHIPSNWLGFLTTEPKSTVRDGVSNTGWGLKGAGKNSGNYDFFSMAPCLHTNRKDIFLPACYGFDTKLTEDAQNRIGENG